jgi:autotransporter-associated beta strand protein
MTTQYWITGTAGDWSTAADWSLGVVPTSTVDAVINNTNAVTVNGTAAANSLILNSSTLTVSGSLTLGTSLTLETGLIQTELILSGGSLSAQSITSPIAYGGYIYGHGTINAAVNGQIVIYANSGTLNLQGSITDPANLVIEPNATLELSEGTSSPVFFQGTPATLKLDAPAAFTGSITSIYVGDTIDLGGIAASSATYSGTTLTINETNGQQLTYNNVSGTLAGDFVNIANDNNGGTLVYWTTTPPLNATWLANPASGNWATGSNWTTGSVPTGTAAFGVSSQTTISISSPTSIDAIQFNSGAVSYTFNVSGDLSVGGGIANNSSFAPIFNNTGTINFLSSSSAANASIINTGFVYFSNGNGGDATITNNAGGTTYFESNSTPENATIINNYGGTTIFQGVNVNAGNATIITNAGGITYADGGPNPQFVTNAGGVADFSGGIDTGTRAGSISGAGTYYLGGGELILNLPASATVSGTINDGGASGGTGASLYVTYGVNSPPPFETFTLSGLDTYTGGTTVDRVVLAVSLGTQAGTSYSSVGSGMVTLLDATFKNVSGGSLIFANDFKLGPSYPFSGPLAGTVGGTFDTSGGNLTITGSIADYGQLGSIAVIGGGTLVLSGNNTYTGGTTISAGTLQIGNGGTTGSISGSVTDNSVFAINLSDAYAFGGLISGNGAFQQLGTGITILTGANTYSGGTTLDGGTLDLAASGAAGTGLINFAAGNEILKIENAALSAHTFGNTINSFSGTDVIDLSGLAFVMGATATFSAGTHTLTVTSNGVTDTLTLTNPGGTVFNAISDGAFGTEILLSQTMPTVASIMATTDNHATDLNAGHLVTITVATSEAVTVTGTPTLQLNDNEVATYSSGSGTNALTFTYTVQAGDNVADLQVAGLNLPSGASIQNAGNNLAGGVTGNLGIQTDTTPPTVTITSTGGLTNHAAQTISGTVDVGDSGSVVTLYDGATAIGTATVPANGSWSDTITLRANGINTLTAQDTDAAGNTGISNPVVYTLNAVGLTISSLTGVTDNGATDINAGHLVTITMTTTEVATVTGTPTLQLNDGEVAGYANGSGTSVLTFVYAVQPGDNTADLRVTGLNLPTGTSIVDGSGNSLSGPVASDLGIQIDTTTVPPTSVQQEILGLYSALYNRATDFDGALFWTGVAAGQPDGSGVTTANAGSTAVTVNDATVLGQFFVNTQSSYFNSVYGGLSDSAFINAMYVNIGGNAGDPGGIVYWVNLLQQAEAAGQSVQAARAGLVGQFVHDLIDYNINDRPAGLTDAQWQAAVQRQEAIDNKIAVSLDYSNASQQPGGSILVVHTVGDTAYQAATTVLQGVTYDSATVTAAIVGINNAVAHHDLSII